MLTNSRPRETERSGEVWGAVSVLAVVMLAVSAMARLVLEGWRGGGKVK